MLRPVTFASGPRRQARQRGSTFIYVAGAVGIASVAAVSYLVTADNGRERAGRQAAAAAEEINLEERVLEIKQGVEQQALASAQVDLDAALAAGADSSANFRLRAEQGAGQVVSLENFAGAAFTQGSVVLTVPGDPFAGARARVQSLSLTAQTGSHDAQPSRVADKQVTEDPQIDLRQIPVSEFTLYVAGAAAQVNPLNFGSDIGRVYVRGDLQVTGFLASSYPVASGGRLTLTSDSGMELRHSGLAGPAVRLTGGFDSGVPEFLAAARTELAAQVAAPPSIPMNAGVTPTVYQASATGTGGGNAPFSLPAFEANCAVHVTVTGLQPGQDERRAAGRDSSRYAVSVSGLENSEPGTHPAAQQQPFAAANRNGVTVVAFDYAALGARPAPDSIDIRVYSGAGLDVNAVVLVRGAGRLAGDLSIVTPHPIILSGDFNVTPVNGVVPAASLVTAQGVQMETEADAVWARDTFGAALAEGSP